MYYINDIPFSFFGLVPGRADNSNLAITGCWDMPQRIGKTHHVWEDSNEIEPYLHSDEMFFGGRDINVICWLGETDRQAFIEKIQSLYDELDNRQNGLFTLKCPWGEWQVQTVDSQSVNYLRNGWGNISLRFRQPVVMMNGTLPTAQSGGVGLDNYSFEQLGLVKVLTKDQANRAQSRELPKVSYGSETIARIRREAREFSIEFFISKPTYSDFLQTVERLAFMLSRPNARTLRLDDGTTREVFVKDGFSVNGVRISSSRVTAFLTVKFTEIRMLENWNFLTDSSGLILTDKHGQPLAEILKGF